MSKPLVIIPAAGYANRLRPIANSVSSAMIPVNGKPIISYILDELKKVKDLYKIVIVVNEYKDVENFVRRSFNGDLPIEFITQYEQKGPLDAVQLAFNSIDYYNETEHISNVLIWLGDTIYLPKTDVNFTLENAFHQDYILISKVDDYRRWCIYDNDSKTLIDKPLRKPKSNKALIGIYNFADVSIFDYSLNLGLKEPTINGSYQISSLIHWYENVTGDHMIPINATDAWYDCGELRTYYDSRSRLLNKSARSFNEISIDTFFNIVTKSANDPDKQAKIEIEKQWFKKIYENDLEQIQSFIPKIFNSKYGVLKMSLEPGTPLNEIWLYDNLTADAWMTILEKILKIQNSVIKQQFDTSKELILRHNYKMYHEKSLNRIKDYKKFGNYKLVKNFLRKVGVELSHANNEQSFKHWSYNFHGDGHVGNIIYEPTTGKLTYVDPRGEFAGIETAGDLRYDMGKLFHDFYCGYPNILGNQYENKNGNVKIFWDEAKIKEIQKFLFKKVEEYGYDINQIKKIAIMLILTCIPFHADDPKRQQAFWDRGISLIKQDFKEYEK